MLSQIKAEYNEVEIRIEDKQRVEAKGEAMGKQAKRASGSDGDGDGGVSELPHDLIVEVLRRLPTKSLMSVRVKALEIVKIAGLKANSFPKELCCKLIEPVLHMNPLSIHSRLRNQCGAFFTKCFGYEEFNNLESACFIRQMAEVLANQVRERIQQADFLRPSS
ncbi:unnamed protein product [Ilex paraguariensis]|uniref:F-box domain-containing protein n=1 Tax=Ilex paraguariensis TaxID=185542 RepID=A0ABC8R8G7_9AQUA